MTATGLLRQTVAACSALAAGAAVVASVMGHVETGIALAAGLVLGSLNGYLIQGLLNRGTPFVAASLLRILFFSSLVLMTALTFRSSAWAVAMGIAVSQLVMVGVGIRNGIRS